MIHTICEWFPLKEKNPVYLQAFSWFGAEERNTPHIPVLLLPGQIRYAYLFTKLYGTCFEHYATHNGL
jgi:hypothetical protein